MSAAHGDHGHGHDDHGHGPDTRTPLVVGAVVIIGFCLGAYLLVRAGTEARAQSADHGQGASAEQREQPQHAAPRQPRAAPVRAAGGSADRINFVATFQRRQQAMGFKFKARAEGPQNDTLEVSWDGAANPKKAEALKAATSFHGEAASRGFKKIVLRADGRVLWEKKL